MKAFAIKDKNIEDKGCLADSGCTENNECIAWLLYYECTKQFCILLSEKANLWNVPIFFSSFVKKGEKTINSYWSKVWVKQRIVPPERQNLAQILKDNGLQEYDEFSLLALNSGRCVQDDCYLETIKSKNIPAELELRLNKNVEEVVPIENNYLLLFFKNGVVKKFNVKEYMQKKTEFSPVLNNEEFFNNVRVGAGGNEISWDEEISVTADVLYDKGENIPLSKEDFFSFIRKRVINGAEAAEMMKCSRQNIDDLVRRGKLQPIKINSKNRLFMKNQIEQRCE